MANIELCRPEPVYIITETVKHALGWGKVTVDGINVGVDAYKVTRQIVQACIAQDYYVDGQRHDGPPSTWEYLKYYLGLAKIEGRDKPKTQVNPLLVYSGFKNLGEALGIRRNIYTPQSYIYGTDPIPNVKLYGNAKINFYMPGGKGHPTAVVIYDPRSKDNKLIQVPPKDQNKVIDMLNNKVSKYQKH